MTTQFTPAPVAPLLGNPRPLPASGGSRGFVVHNDFSAASQIPQIDSRGFVAEAASAGAIGRGIQDVGEGANKLAMVRLHAMNERKVLEADATARLSQAELAKQLAAEPDTNKWEAIAAKHTDELSKSLLTKDLSPDARDAISNRMTEWRGHVISGVQRNAATREIQLLGQQHNANVITALGEKDYTGARGAVDAWDASGSLAPDQKASLQVRINQTEQADQQKAKEEADAGRFNDMLLLTERNPREASDLIAAHNQTRPFTSSEQLRLDHALAVSFNGKRAVANESVAAAIDLGKVRDLEGLASQEGYPYLAEIDKKKWVEVLEKPPVNDTSSYSAAVTAIASYDPSEDPDGKQLAELRTNIAQQFDHGYSQTLRERLDEKLKEDPATAVPLGNVYKAIDKQVEDGTFGQWKKPATGPDGKPVYQATLDADGKAKVREKAVITQKDVPRNWLTAWWTGQDTKQEDEVTKTPVPVIEIDTSARAKAALEAAKLKDSLRAAAAKKEFKTEAEAFEWASKQTGGKVATLKAAGVSRPASLFPTTTPTITPELNDLINLYAPKSKDP